MNETYIKLYRKFLDWEWYDDLPTKALWIHILLKANYKDKMWHGKEVKRGSFYTSYSTLQNDLGLSKKQIERALKNLQKTGELEKVSTRENTLIIVTKYDFYQGTGETRDTREGNVGDTLEKDGGKRGELLNKEKKERIERKEEIYINTFAQSDNISHEQPPIEPSVISITLNDKSEFPISQKMIDEWKELYPSVDIMQELRKMKGWCNSNPTKRKTKRGISRFINSWLAKEQDKPKSKSSNSNYVLSNGKETSNPFIADLEIIRNGEEPF